MKIASLGSFSHDYDTENYILRAMRRLGHKALAIEEAGSTVESIVEECLEFKPDVFLFAKGRVGAEWDSSAMNLKLVLKALRQKNKKIVVACWVFDLLAEEFSPDRWIWAQNIDKLADVFFTTDGFTARRLKRSFVLRQGMPDDTRRGTPRDEWKKDILFLGHPYRERFAFVGELQFRYGERMLVINDGVRGGDLCDLMASVKLVIGPDYPMYQSYHSNRCYVVAGCGGVLVAPTVSGMKDEGWIPWKHYAPYESRQELPEVIDKLLANRTLRNLIRNEGNRLARTKFTYDKRVAVLVREIDKIRTTSARPGMATTA